MFFNHFFKYKTEMKYSLIAILLFSFTALQAQVKGTVRDNLGDPIAGANLAGNHSRNHHFGGRYLLLVQTQ